MTIALDATYSVGGNLTGVGVYSSNLMRALASAHEDVQFDWYYRPHRFLRGRRTERPGNVRQRLLWDWLSPHARLFHGLNQRLPRRCPRRTVCTFHDLFVLTAEYSTREFRDRFAGQARDAAARSDLVICVSEYTARQVESLLRVDAGRLRVIPHGVRARPAAAGPRENMILFAGALQRRKNLVRLVEAFEACHAPGWRLVLAGSTGYGAEEVVERVNRSSKRTLIEMPGFVSDDELNALYAKASIFAFPSLGEGFGIPVIEAMSAGLPVLTSSTSALAEVGGDAALLVDPESTAHIAEGLQLLIENERLRQEMSEKGRLRAGLFTWGSAAERTWAVYRELL